MAKKPTIVAIGPDGNKVKVSENNTIVGYQYGLNNHFIGEYEFINNLDKEEVHLPPNTTLTPPPTIPDGMAAEWDGKGWIIVQENNEHLVSTRDPEPIVIDPTYLPEGTHVPIWDGEKWTVQG